MSELENFINKTAASIDVRWLWGFKRYASDLKRYVWRYQSVLDWCDWPKPLNNLSMVAGVPVEIFTGHLRNSVQIVNSVAT